MFVILSVLMLQKLLLRFFYFRNRNMVLIINVKEKKVFFLIIKTDKITGKILKTLQPD